MSSPASPLRTTFTVIPVSAVNASKIPSLGVNESCASNVSVTGPSVCDDPLSDEPEQAANSSMLSAIAEILFMGVQLSVTEGT
jgi:hypothetical protein